MNLVIKMLSKIISNKEILLAVAVIGGIFFLGSTYGSLSAKEDFEKEKAKQEEVIKQLKAEITKKELDYQAKNDKILQELAESRKNYEISINTVTTDYALQLRKLNDRLRIYQRQAQERKAGLRDDNDYTGRLDSALTEGIRLVKELSATVRFREQQLNLLGSRIKNEQSLISE